MAKVWDAPPVPASHTFTAPSQFPVASRFPSGLQATLVTLPSLVRFRLDFLLHRHTTSAAMDGTARGIWYGFFGTAQESERLPERLVFSEKGLWLA